MTVRIVKRRGKRRLVLEIVYAKPDGSQGRIRRDAEVKMLAAARAEERRRLALLVSTGSPAGRGENPKEERPPKPKARPVFKEIAAEYLRSFAPTRLKPSTIHGYKRLLDGFLLPRIGHLRLDQVDAKVVRELDAERVKGVVRESVWGGETASPKSGHERIVPLTPRLRAALANTRERDRDALVARTEQWTPWREWGLRQAFARARKRAGVEPVRLHDLRHYFVTALFRYEESRRRPCRRSRAMRI